MTVETVGNPPPEADQMRLVVQQQLPDIIASFNQVLREQYGLQGIGVGGFTLVPDGDALGGISCDQESCSIS